MFHNFLCKYSDKALPNNFEEVGLIIDEYKKAGGTLKIVDSLKVNKKNKHILVRGKKNLKKNFKVLWLQLNILIL